ncbi:MAG TPA: MopE-related protein [Polyangia bacterium]|nr:MopE-related protein [Polyangia bacterium]
MRVRSSAPLMSLLVSAGIAAVATMSACNRANPNYHPGETLTGDDAGLTGQAGSIGAAGSMGVAGFVGGTAGATDGGSDATLGSCKTASDCLAARGAAPCAAAGSWDCRAGACAVVCPSCTDKDSDGYGIGAGCAGLDCNDNDPTIGKTATRSCYDGKGGTLNVGACRAGSQLCSAGVWATTCTGQILPAGEACNGVDDDCNGKVDDDGLGTISCGFGACAQTAPACTNGVLGVCKPGTPTAVADLCDGKDESCDGVVDDGCAQRSCVFVSPVGDDMLGTGSALRPFRSIQAAISSAASPQSTTKSVCVAGGLTCFDAFTYDVTAEQPLTMANGVSVYGNYEARTWTRCAFGTTGLPTLTVTIAPRGAAGVTFPATVTTPTTLDGVHVKRSSGNGGGGAATTTAGITVTGAKQVTISNVMIDEDQASTISYGVNLTGGAEALITRSAIFGGGASASAIGVHSAGSKPTIRENCATVDPTTGHCTATCSATSLGIHGRYAPANGNGNGGGMGPGGPGTATIEGVAIDLVDSPGAIVERNAICGTEGTSGAGVRVGGVSTGIVVRGNSITSDGATGQAIGVSLLACGDAAPWIVDNEVIVGDPVGQSTRAAGINVSGACHPVIDGNTKIAPGASGSPMTALGVYCGPDTTMTTSVPSRCFISGNKSIQGSPTTRPSASYAVSCDVGSCARVTGNALNGQSGATVVGILLRETGAYVDRNVITGGCGTKTTTAVLADDAFARVENNVVHGAACGVNATTPEADGVRVHVGTSNEVEIDANTIIAGGAGQCVNVAAGIGLGNGAGPTAPHGIFRNNILRAGGACTIGRDDFIETEAGAAPRIFSHNDLDPTGMPTLLLLPQPPSPTTVGDINQLAGASGNVSLDPMFTSATDYHLAAGSLLINAGSAADPPRTDFDGKPRNDGLPDIGAFEH